MLPRTTIKVDDSHIESRILTRKVVICEEGNNSIINLLHGVISTGFNCTPKILYSDKES